MEQELEKFDRSKQDRAIKQNKEDVRQLIGKFNTNKRSVPGIAVADKYTDLSKEGGDGIQLQYPMMWLGDVVTLAYMGKIGEQAKIGIDKGIKDAKQLGIQNPLQVLSSQSILLTFSYDTINYKSMSISVYYIFTGLKSCLYKCRPITVNSGMNGGYFIERAFQYLVTYCCEVSNKFCNDIAYYLNYIESKMCSGTEPVEEWEIRLLKNIQTKTALKAIDGTPVDTRAIRLKAGALYRQYRSLVDTGNVAFAESAIAQGLNFTDSLTGNTSSLYYLLSEYKDVLPENVTPRTQTWFRDNLIDVKFVNGKVRGYREDGTPITQSAQKALRNMCTYIQYGVQ